LFTTGDFDSAQIGHLGLERYSEQIYNSSEKYVSIKFYSISSLSSYNAMLDSLRQNPYVISISPYIKRNFGEPVGTSERFYIAVNDTTDTIQLRQYADSLSLSIEPLDPLLYPWYTMVNRNKYKNGIELTNIFEELNVFAGVDPGFHIPFKPNCGPKSDILPDALFNSISGDYTINICSAWTRATGKNTNIAIMDDMIFLDHLEFGGNAKFIRHIGIFDQDNQTVNTPSLSPYYLTNKNRWDSSYPTLRWGHVDGHGTSVASITAARYNDSLMAGVAYDAKLIEVYFYHGIGINVTNQSFVLEWMKKAFKSLWQGTTIETHVLNCSWGDQGGKQPLLQSKSLDSSIKDLLDNGRNGKGTVIVFGAGNQGKDTVDYPGYIDDRIITVGGIDNKGKRYSYIAPPDTSISSYGYYLDVMAPGFGVACLTNHNNTMAYITGTSQAAPQVAGIAAMILEINPCLTNVEVADIIEKTSRKIQPHSSTGITYNYSTHSGRPNGAWNNEMGYGLVDAYAAVKYADSTKHYYADLWMARDELDVYGTEPYIFNYNNFYPWESSAIWLGGGDNPGKHKDPNYAISDSTKINIVLKNKSNCMSSSGTDTLYLYWAKAGVGLYWDKNWNGTLTQGGKLMGGAIDTVIIPKVLPGQPYEYNGWWHFPNPSDYDSIVNEPFHFCLLARIGSKYDTMTVKETTDMVSNVSNNNNIAWKNINILNNAGAANISAAFLKNVFSIPKLYNVEFEVAANDVGKLDLFNRTVKAKISDTMFNIWQLGGGQYQGLIDYDTVGDDKMIRIKSDYVKIENIFFDPDQFGYIAMQFNDFEVGLGLTDYITYRVIVRDANTDSIIGGNTWHVYREEDTPLMKPVNAGGDKKVHPNEGINLIGSLYNKPATYQWLNSKGQIMHEGREWTIEKPQAGAYIYVVRDNETGKEYRDTMLLSIRKGQLVNLAPNPTKGEVNIEYAVHDAKDVKVRIISVDGKQAFVYPLNISMQSHKLSLQDMASGSYIVNLICDGEITDTKLLIKE
jgi:serine protease